MRKDRFDSATLAARAPLISILAALIALPAVVDAATFDEKVSGPTQLTGDELKAKARDYFENFDNGSAAMSSLLRNPDEHAKWFELRWQLGQAVDATKPLDGLSEYGISARGDGSYSVDLERFPQWDPLDHKMQGFFSPGSRDRTMQALKERGFRNEEIAALRQYLENNSPELAVTEATTPVTTSFAARVKKRAAAGQRLNRAEMLSYKYQLNRSTTEATRAWAIGLLNSLDRQRQRILESYLMEVDYSMAIFPSGEENPESLEDYFLSDRYLEAIEQQTPRAE